MNIPVSEFEILADKAKESDSLIKVLKRIRNTSYVGNYSPEQVIVIYRKWAHNAVEAYEIKCGIVNE